MQHRTGTVVGCLRKFQGWSVPRALDEYRHYAGIKSRERDQLKIKHYSLDLCWDKAVANGWVPTAFAASGGKLNEPEHLSVDSLLGIPTPAAIKAQ